MLVIKVCSYVQIFCVEKVVYLQKMSIFLNIITIYLIVKDIIILHYFDIINNKFFNLTHIMQNCLNLDCRICPHSCGNSPHSSLTPAPYNFPTRFTDFTIYSLSTLNLQQVQTAKKEVAKRTGRGLGCCRFSVLRL